MISEVHFVLELSAADVASLLVVIWVMLVDKFMVSGGTVGMREHLAAR